MTRLVGSLLALLFSVLPTADVVCRAVCAPNATSTAAPSCHEVAPQTADGALVPAVACQREAVAAAVAGEAARSLVSPAPLATTQAVPFVYLPSSTTADVNRRSVRPRPPQACPSTNVLRI